MLKGKLSLFFGNPRTQGEVAGGSKQKKVNWDRSQSKDT